MTGAQRRIAILGGGMGGLSAAWHLSEPGWRDEFESITVYQRGFRLGGKGASSRGVHGRIEEHGLHVVLGYYDNTFRMMRDVYTALDRDTSDPACPIRTWRDAVVPAPLVGVMDHRHGRWHEWIAAFPVADDEPGITPPPPLTPLRFVTRAAELVARFVASTTTSEHQGSGLRLSSRPATSPVATATVIRTASAAAFAAVTEVLSLARSITASVDASGGAARELLGALDAVHDVLAERVARDVASSRMFELVDVLVAASRGIVVDGLLAGPIGFPAIDDLDFRAWLAKHGAAPATLGSPLIRGLYDLVFAYEGGRSDRPAFAAGLGLFLAGKLFLDHRGSMFWKMTAGMGDVVFAPLLQALRARGVRIELLHQIDRVALDADGRRVAAVELTRQAEPADGGELDPLVRVRGLPCFPAVLPADRTAARTELAVDTERHSSQGSDRVVLRDGVDFDDVVFALSLGMVPLVAPDLLEWHSRWRTLVDMVQTVPTQALQLWLRPTERELGWPAPGAVVSGYFAPFDTFASMSHLTAAEAWPRGGEPGTIAYFCSVLDDRAEPADEAVARVSEHATRFLDAHAGRYFPRAVAGGRFDWTVACETPGGGGLAAQHVVAAVDPSDRYVQSLPGSGRARLRADESGVDNLVLAGDWIATGLDAGCIEAAVLSGIQAANAVRGRPLREGVMGSWPGGR